MSHNTKVQRRQGGDELHFALGAKLSAEAEAVTLASNAGEINAMAGKITTEALTTAAAGSQALTLTNNLVEAGDIVMATLNGGTSATGSVELRAVATANTITFTLTNRHASAAFNGTFIIGFMLIKQN